MSSAPLVCCLSPLDVVRSTYDKRRDQLPAHRWHVLSDRSPTGVRDVVADADVVIGDWTGELELRATDLAAATRCQAILQPSAGYQGIDVDAAHELGIPVANAPGANATSVAEWAVMAMLMTLRKVVQEDKLLRHGHWRMVEASQDGIHDLAGRTVGIVGFGAIGQRVARRLAGFEVGEILTFDTLAIDPETLASTGARQVELDVLCREADVVTLHVPLLQSTEGLMNRDRLELLGPRGVLVNTCRGAVVDEDALHTMLQRREIAGAALDVFSGEPLAPGHRWAELDNVTLSPHLSGSTVEARHQMIGAALDNLAAVLEGHLPDHVVNRVATSRRGPEPA